MSDWSKDGPRLWAELHLWALQGKGNRERFLNEFVGKISCGSCRTDWIEYVKANPITNHCSFTWSVAAHNAMNVKLGKPVMPFEAARDHWLAVYRAGGVAKPNETWTKAPESLLLVQNQPVGDIIMLTAAVRDLKKATGDRYKIAVETWAMPLFENNPHVVSKSKLGPNVRRIECHYPLINQSHRPYHFLHGIPQYLEEQLGVKIPVTEFKGDIHLSAAEKSAPGPVEKLAGYVGKYWIMMAGGKNDFTTKWWNPASYQKVVDHFAGRLTFVQLGGKDHPHTPLRNTINLIGKTSLRDYVRAMYWADGVVCPVTSAMHLAAAVPSYDLGVTFRPCVVIAGGREPAHFTQYPGHRFLDTIGSPLKCCKKGPCWKARCQLVGDGSKADKESLCESPVQVSADLRIPECMEMITPERVIEAIEGYQPK